MKRTLLTLTTVGLLAMPAGIAVAENNTPDPTPPATSCDQERERARDRVQDEERLVVQHRERIELRLEDGTCDGDCVDAQVRERDQAQLGDSAGLMLRFRHGEMGRR